MEDSGGRRAPDSAWGQPLRRAQLLPGAHPPHAECRWRRGGHQPTPLHDCCTAYLFSERRDGTSPSPAATWPRTSAASHVARTGSSPALPLRRAVSAPSRSAWGWCPPYHRRSSICAAVDTLPSRRARWTAGALQCFLSDTTFVVFFIYGGASAPGAGEEEQARLDSRQASGHGGILEEEEEEGSSTALLPWRKKRRWMAPGGRWCMRGSLSPLHPTTTSFPSVESTVR
jgi:hypothetical protein